MKLNTNFIEGLKGLKNKHGSDANKKEMKKRKAGLIVEEKFNSGKDRLRGEETEERKKEEEEEEEEDADVTGSSRRGERSEAGKCSEQERKNRWFDAVMNGDRQTIGGMLSLDVSIVALRNEKGYTALHQAIEQGSDAIFDLLISSIKSYNDSQQRKQQNIKNPRERQQQQQQQQQQNIRNPQEQQQQRHHHQQQQQLQPIEARKMCPNCVLQLERVETRGACKSKDVIDARHGSHGTRVAVVAECTQQRQSQQNQRQQPKQSQEDQSDSGRIKRQVSFGVQCSFRREDRVLLPLNDEKEQQRRRQQQSTLCENSDHRHQPQKSSNHLRFPPPPPPPPHPPQRHHNHHNHHNHHDHQRPHKKSCPLSTENAQRRFERSVRHDFRPFALQQNQRKHHDRLEEVEMTVVRGCSSMAMEAAAALQGCGSSFQPIRTTIW